MYICKTLPMLHRLITEITVDIFLSVSYFSLQRLTSDNTINFHSTLSNMAHREHLGEMTIFLVNLEKAIQLCDSDIVVSPGGE